MESLGIIKAGSDKITKFKEKWIAYIDHGDGYTENLIALNSQMEMMFWLEDNLESRPDGYYHNGVKVCVKKRSVV